MGSLTSKVVKLVFIRPLMGLLSPSIFSNQGMKTEPQNVVLQKR